MWGFAADCFREEMKHLENKYPKKDDLLYQLAFKCMQYKDIKKLFDDSSTENAALKGRLSAMIDWREDNKVLKQELKVLTKEIQRLKLHQTGPGGSWRIMQK